ncbi:hypothetical protein BAOM_3000 [Peribacillus asahii]|uniref:Uncharacterized protein n=1 Tax=Peribacillus asahii TaxID=228899 RepID=A0A3Q9RP53_9BACI|nr:hypothetical protein [Peribacillus asahii]AZV43609.1 hypothetical protein BAOM_3000 [Peribacillus asahii]
MSKEEIVKKAEAQLNKYKEQKSVNDIIKNVNIHKNDGMLRRILTIFRGYP